MNILIVVWNFYPNTAYTNHTKATLNGFRESGAKCDVFTIKPIIQSDDDVLNNKITPANSRLRTLVSMVVNYLKLKPVAKSYDTIYCSTSNIRVVNRIQYIAKELGKKCVHERTEYPDVFIPADSKELQEYCNAVKKYDKVFTISTYIKKFFVNHGVPIEKIQLYPMIVDPNRFNGINKQKIGYRYIAYCGNLQNAKDGVSDLIEAYVQTKIANKTFKLLLIGGRPVGKDYELYNNLITKYNLQDKVIFQGQVISDEMPQMLKNADILALSRPANRQSEGGFPTKLGEYLATGNPVVVTSVGDIPLYIIDGFNGYLCQPDDIYAFSKKLDYIALNYQEASHVGERGKELVYNVFNYKQQAEKVLNTLQKL